MVLDKRTAVSYTHLIDEYDVLIQAAYIKGFYNEAIEFLKNFYRTTFKDNSYLEKTVLTGVSRVAKESIFSGANNFKVFTVLDNEFADDFGITSKEMDKVIEDFNVEDEKEEIKKWYTNGIYGNDSSLTPMLSAYNGRQDQAMPHSIRDNQPYGSFHS